MSATAVAELASVPHGCDLLCENEMALFTREHESPLHWFTGQLPVRPALALAPREAWLTPWGALGALLAGNWLGLGPSPSDARGGWGLLPRRGIGKASDRRQNQRPVPPTP
jgi:hypothetical protein